MGNTKRAVAIGLMAALGLAGCWESSDITVHEAGKYKGGKDPLLNQQASSRAESLQKRFQLVQSDR